MDNTFNINEIPFSRFGSFLAISPIWKRDDNDLYIRSVRGGDMSKDHGKIFKLIPVNNKGERINYSVQMNEVELTLQADDGLIRFCIDDNNTLRILGENIGLKIRMDCGSYDNAFSTKEDEILVNNFSNDLKILAKAFQGTMVLDAPWNIISSKHVEIFFLPSKDNYFYAGLKESKTVMKKDILHNTYEVCLQEVKEDYEAWSKKMPVVPESYSKGKRIASYITWSAVVPNEGNLTRPAMYMSKNWMTNIWSWDNCFNAMALIKNNPELAWDQFMIAFDKQLDNGLIPDFINDKYDYFSCTKPPIHGWTLLYMMRENPKFFTKEILEEAYVVLEKWTDYWFNYTDYDNSGLPSYNHGNDSGWDNSTIFNESVPLKSPDLLSYLIIQIKGLEAISEQLGNHDLKNKWKDRYEKELEKLIDTFWTGEKFTYINYNEVGQSKNGDSLILYMPLILGDMLPVEITKVLVEGICKERRFLTPFGLATESTKSSLFKEDGYWRGPIWAPSTMILVDGLFKSGYKEIGKDIAKRFVEMANENGMAENFNPLKGHGLSDKAFTWTSSVFMILAEKYIN